MQQYIMPMARNTRTGQTVKSQDLSGQRLPTHQRQQAQLLADRLAAQMSERGQDSWQAVLTLYTPTVK
jgi:hypothetical protein